MIDRVIGTLSKELAAYLDIVAGLDVEATEHISVSQLFDSSGDALPRSLGITLVNIEEDRINKANDPYVKSSSGYTKVNPEIRLNLFVLFSANFKDNYDEALKFISYVIQFFQGKQVFTRENTPDLDKEVAKLIVELHPMSFEQQNYLWGMIGGKYMPSALYKIRLLVVQDNVSLHPITEMTSVKSLIGK